MPLLFYPSMHTGRYRLGRHPGRLEEKTQAAWSTIVAAFPHADSVVSFWALADALASVSSEEVPSAHPHALIRYCIKRGWLQRM